MKANLSQDETLMDIREEIKQFIIENLILESSIRDISDEDLLIESGIIDSMGILNLLAYLDEKFDISFSEGEITRENFGSLKRICALVEKKRTQG